MYEFTLTNEQPGDEIAFTHWQTGREIQRFILTHIDEKYGWLEMRKPKGKKTHTVKMTNGKADYNSIICWSR